MRTLTIGMLVAMAFASAGCIAPGPAEGGRQMNPEERQALTDEMMAGDSFSSGYIDGADGSVGSP